MCIQKGGFTGTKFSPGSAASFEEPTYLVCVNALLLERFQMWDIDILGGAGSRNPTLTSNLLQPTLRILILGKAPFIETECRGVIITASVDHSGRMLYVKHFVIENEFNEPIRHLS